MEVRLLFVLLLVHYASSLGRSAASPVCGDVVGISPQDEEYYKALSMGVSIKCKDGSNKFTKSQLNDDFCDCTDGSDEPGTSACPEGKFFCKNAGHSPIFIYSSRVNDGICDCCDGSDEHASKTKCSNTCWEAGKEARDKLKKKIETYREGVVIRKQEIAQAKLAIVKEEEELSTLKNKENTLKDLVEELKAHKEEIEKAEEKERLEKEKETQRKEVEQTKLEETKTHDESENHYEAVKHNINEEIQKADDKERLEKEKETHGKEVEQTKLEETKTHNESENHYEAVKDNINEEIGLLDNSLEIQNEVEDHDVALDKVEISDSTMDEFPSEESDQVPDDFPKLVEKQKQPSNDGGCGGRCDDGGDDKFGHITSEENEEIQNTESLSREELGRLVGSRWTGKMSEQGIEVKEAPKGNDQDEHDDHHDEVTNETDEEYDAYDSEDDLKNEDDDAEAVDDVEEYGGEDNHVSSSSYKSESDDDFDLGDATNPSWIEKIKQNVRRLFVAVNLFRTPVNISDATRVRKDYDESSAKLSKIQSRISSLTQKLKHDFGPDKEFYSYYDQCFESKQNKYTYKICPFKEASQVEGYSTTRLGNWDKFEDSYRTMQFSNGDKCWNGPNRSLKVKLRCGLKNEVVDVDEPSRCEYLAFLSTPALCLEEKLQELQEKLEMMMKNEDQPQGHDEL
ncbi:unnamed protein product [Cuscuta epithymum]|uniref:Glucosidase 2 subunit beta n=2 Tax=Cuscuta epithymum TaxID=186058 RepID=A0AAV0D6M0_9ASTE|nr:unnamed protein product [Cuscuta epithymum]